MMNAMGTMYNHFEANFEQANLLCAGYSCAEMLERPELVPGQSTLPLVDEKSTENAIAAADRLVLRRWKANARERQRVKLTGTAFEQLRHVLPVEADECHLTRMDVLCRAMEYIRVLEREAHGTGPGQPPLLHILRPEGKDSRPDVSRKTQATHLDRHYRPECGIRKRRDSGYSDSSFLSDDSFMTASSADSWNLFDSLQHQATNYSSSTTIIQPKDRMSDYESDSSSSASSKSWHVRRRMPASRVTVNRQLRTRSKVMQNAFKDLREVVPVDPNNPHLTKAKFLRQASRYIAHLRSLLDTDTGDNSLTSIGQQSRK